jgi:hypothetical protein
MSRVRAVPVASGLIELAGLDHVDYSDAFETRTPVRQTPEQWGRLTVDCVQPALPRLIRAVHTTLGFRLAPGDAPGQVLGWTIRRSDDDVFVLATGGGIGTARIVMETPPGRVVFSTLIRFDSRASRPVWIGVKPLHRRVARYLLGHVADVAEKRERAAR